MVTKHSSLHFSTNSPYMSFSWHLRHGYKSDPTAASSLYTWPPDLVESCCLDATPLYRERGLEGRREGEEGGRRKGGGREEEGRGRREGGRREGGGGGRCNDIRSPKGGTPLTVQLESLVILNFKILQF